MTRTRTAAVLPRGERELRRGVGVRMRRGVILGLLLLLGACGVEGPPEPVPGGVGIEGPRIRVVGRV